MAGAFKKEGIDGDLLGDKLSLKRYEKLGVLVDQEDTCIARV